MKYFVYLFFLLISAKNCAQQHPKGENLLDYKKIRFFKTAKDTYGHIDLVGKYNKKAPENTEFLVTTTKQPPFIYNLAANLPILKKSFKSGRVFLLTFKAKTQKASLETGEAKVLWQFKQTDSHKDHLFTTVSVSSEWQTYYVPFKITKDISKENIALVMQYGYRTQSFLLKDIRFEVYPENTKVTDLPKTKITYQGMESDANWRKEANARIEKIRKGNFSLKVLKNGKPLKNISVKITQIKHYFPFGAALRAKEIVGNTAVYKNFKKGFNLVVLENDLKIKPWQLKKKRAITLQALDILKKDSIDVKGHVLIWPGFRYLTKAIKKNQHHPEKVKRMIRNHVTNILKLTKGKVSHWDVVNEAYTNKDLQKITGSEDILYDGFRIAHKINPKVGRFTNEYGIISKGGIDKKKQEWYYDFIKRIDKNTGGLVDGIGIQSHIGSDLTPPSKVLSLLDYYGKLNKKISISEFTMDVQDPEIRAQYTRDFMIAAFSHPKVSEFLFWGNTQDEKNKVDIFTKEGGLGVMGNVFFDLVHKQWKTKLSTKTDRKGSITTSGFYGTYTYEFNVDGKKIKGIFKVLPNQENYLKIKL